MLQFSLAYRNALLDALVSSIRTVKIWSGSQPENCAAADSGISLVVFTLGGGAWNVAKAGAKHLNNLPLSANAGNSGKAGYFRLYDASAICQMQGTVGLTGTDDPIDMALDNISINVGQQVKITDFGFMAPGA